MHGGQPEIDTRTLLQAYAAGLFPMSDSADDPDLFWVEPRQRGIIPLDGFHLSRRLKRTVRSERYLVRTDTDFDAVIAACAETAEGRKTTWINQRIRALYRQLFDLGQCHTVEAYDGEQLVGGLYGVSLGGCFFGESMFHRARDASKVVLVHLVAHLIKGGYRLLDTQFLTEHLSQFGAIEIPRNEYKQRLNAALPYDGRWDCGSKGRIATGSDVIAILEGSRSPSA